MLYVVFLWWFSTGAIIYLDGLPRRTYRWSMLGATVLSAAALYGLAVTSNDVSVAGAYIAFTCAILIWGWVEMSFLMGLITGSRRTRCPDNVHGGRRFLYAIQAIIHHELALLIGAAAILWVTWGGANLMGLYTFLILWVMRTSTKLNVFLGVRNLNEEWLPDHLRYLESYFRKRPMNLLFPVSVTLSTVAAVWLVQMALSDQVSAHQATMATFLAILMILAILEHWFLVLPMPSQALWNWALHSRQSEPQFHPISPSIPAANDADKDAPDSGLTASPTRFRS
ncbi:putative photosynthetic complex assembly protein 2 [Ectothiorhodospira magna]|uniref:Putative photosynthetic complex assembly protein 2 n=2 Tax=Ectothiorhodospira magna TaxID=867345 RepID=A0A1H9BYY1_9GAMM|nr:putative photosynthetic complex assembly protein 2 [Ectothiorhodospira magna]